jgi:hypothetical protein
MSNTKLINAVSKVVAFIQDKTGVRTVYGDEDTGASEMPLVRLISDQEGLAVSMNGNARFNTQLPVSAQVRVPKGQEMRCLQLMEIIITAIRELDRAAGYTLGTEIDTTEQRANLTPSYEENGSVFQYSIPILINEIL